MVRAIPIRADAGHHLHDHLPPLQHAANYTIFAVLTLRPHAILGGSGGHRGATCRGVCGYHGDLDAWERTMLDICR
ncbi:hypothetical protein BDA96_01G346800 [Sorghum bicolor]|uniref:Uncharacterized protein n=2 Tax=Sorghum bicolor TaxID=4558 RepID=A0A921S1Z6_SORBI|nr:hypothetical protein BDA96_01G346800 [Sorghum bicolor]KXG39053.1 hypothetical protein SORBI_3001G323200 [Sorghum bicolor]